ncbi:MAG TPA: hypothetical protein VIV60_24090 [Polyangiaceae bacterium]
MKIEINVPNPTPQTLRQASVLGFVVLSAAILTKVGFAAWLLFVAFCLMLAAIALFWASVTTVSDSHEVSLEEALELAAPARDEERKLAILRGIKDLEYERGLGKISEQDYDQLLQRYREEAKRILQRLDTSEQGLRQRALDAAVALLDKRDDQFVVDGAELDSGKVER